MSKNNNEFQSAYNTLDNLLKRITNISSEKNLISYYEKVIPEPYASQLKTIRKFKNDITSHGVAVKGQLPEAPREFTIFLREQINYVNNHRNVIASKIIALLNKKQKNHKTNTNNSNSRNNIQNNSSNKKRTGMDHALNSATSLRTYYGNTYSNQSTITLSWMGRQILSQAKIHHIDTSTYTGIENAATFYARTFKGDDLLPLLAEYGIKHSFITANKEYRELGKIFAAQLRDDEIKYLKTH